MKMPLRHLLQITVSLVLVFTLTACGTTRKVLNLETTAEFKLVASQDVNPTTAGRAAPLVVQVITLRDARPSP